MASTKSFRITGLWTKSLKGGTHLLQAKISLDTIQDVINQARDYGLDSAVLEVWENRDRQDDRSPSHQLKLAEPFQPQATNVPNNQTVREASQTKRKSSKDAFPF